MKVWSKKCSFSNEKTNKKPAFRWFQEIDLATGTLSSIQSGSRKLLGKSNVVYTIQVHGGLLYSAGNPLDGASVKVRILQIFYSSKWKCGLIFVFFITKKKIWSVANYELVGSLASALEVRSIAVSSELIYLGCKGGTVEIWCKEKLTRVDTLQIGSTARINSVAIDAGEEFLVVGTADGQIQVLSLRVFLLIILDDLGLVSHVT